MRRNAKLTLFDRLAIGLLSAVFGILTSVIVWFFVALNFSDTQAHAASFLFAPTAFAVGGFITGEAFADVLGAWFHGILAMVNALPGNVAADPDPEAFKPWPVAIFLLVVVAVTIWLSLP